MIAGQGTVGLEILEQCPDVGTIITAVGGGGLVSGLAVAAKATATRRPDHRCAGGRRGRLPAVAGRRAPRCGWTACATIADGIAVRRPGELTFAHVSKLVDEIVTVTDEDLSRALLMLLERHKMVVEPAGAAAVAALLAGAVQVSVAGGGDPVRRQHRPDAAAAGDRARAGRRRALPAAVGALRGPAGCSSPGCSARSPSSGPTWSTWRTRGRTRG